MNIGCSRIKYNPKNYQGMVSRTETNNSRLAVRQVRRQRAELVPGRRSAEAQQQLGEQQQSEVGFRLRMVAFKKKSPLGAIFIFPKQTLSIRPAFFRSPAIAIGAEYIFSCQWFLFLLVIGLIF